MKTKFAISFILSITITLCALLNTGCEKNKHEPSKKLKLVMGVSADYPPFEFIKNGEYSGLDIDIANAITKHLGYDLEIADMDFSGLIPSLNSGRVDFIMSSLTITEERQKNVDFTSTYFLPSFALISLKAIPVFTEAQLKNQKVGVQLASTMEKYARDLANRLDGQLSIQTRNLTTQLIQELLVGRVSAVIVEEQQALVITEKNHELTYTLLPYQDQNGYAIAFRKESPLLINFNTAIEHLEKTGKLTKIRQKWFHQAKQDSTEK